MYLTFFAKVLILMRNTYMPYARTLAYTIAPCHPDWYWQYRINHNPGNDNE